MLNLVRKGEFLKYSGKNNSNIYINKPFKLTFPKTPNNCEF